MCQFVDSKIWVIFFRYSCWTLVLPPVCLKLPPKLPHNIICFPSRPIFFSFPPPQWPFSGFGDPPPPPPPMIQYYLGYHLQGSFRSIMSVSNIWYGQGYLARIKDPKDPKGLSKKQDLRSTFSTQVLTNIIVVEILYFSFKSS